MTGRYDYHTADDRIVIYNTETTLEVAFIPRDLHDRAEILAERIVNSDERPCHACKQPTPIMLLDGKAERLECPECYGPGWSLP